MLDRVQLKYEAKAITKNAKESAYVFTLIYLAIGLVLDGIDYLVSGSPQTEVYGYLADYMPEAAVYLRGTEPILHLPTPAVWFVSIVISLVTAVLGAGYILYTMNVRKGLITPYTTLFDGFLFAGKIILLEIVQYIFVFLWSLLFIIPGIIAGYRYRFALYNLCENPEMGVMEALNMSKAQTRGHKWERSSAASDVYKRQGLDHPVRPDAGHPEHLDHALYPADGYRLLPGHQADVRRGLSAAPGRRGVPRG